MKNGLTVKIGEELEAEAVRVLRAVPDLDVVITPSASGPDAAISYHGNDTPVFLEFKQRVSSAQAHQLVAWAKTHPDTRVVLVAGESTATARDILTEGGVGVVDGAGNVNLALPGLLVRLEGTRRTPASKPPAQLSGKSSLVVQAMLLEPERAWQVGELAERADVSAGLAHRVVSRLEDEGVVDSTGSGPTRTRSVTNPTALLDLWAEEHRDRPRRTSAYLLAQSARELVTSLTSALDSARTDYALTGSAAATTLAPFVTAVPVTELWISSAASVEDVLDTAGATIVSEGPNVVFLQAKDDGPLAFRERTPDGVWTTNIFRLYLDLRRDPRRGVEQSDHLRREVIGF